MNINVCEPEFSKSVLLLVFIIISLITSIDLKADEDSWQSGSTLEAYWQNFNGSTPRKSAFNLGVSINKDYLETIGFGVSYDFTFLDLEQKSELIENLLQIYGQYHVYLDQPAGKLSLRMDTYIGENTLKIRTSATNTIGVGMGRRRMVTSSTSIVSDRVDINVYNPQMAYMNQNKTLYVDLGYAYSEYRGSAFTKVNQLTPTVGFGWNEQYDWLQLRGYLIKVDDITNDLNKTYNSVEVKYIHWFDDSQQSALLRLAVLFGERLLAVDPDAGAVYSISDEQSSSLSAGVEWSIADSSKVLTMVSYSEYKNIGTNDHYSALLFYINAQLRW